MIIPDFYKKNDRINVNCEKPTSHLIRLESDEKAKRSKELDFTKKLSSYHKTLCGDWNFKFYNCIEEAVDFTGVDFCGEDFNKIAVPISWQSVGYDTPHYSCSKYVIPNDPPHLPDDIPCGAYYRDFEIPSDWDNKQINLTFEGVDSCFYLYVNGEFTAYGQGSYSPWSIDITQKLRAGKNRIAVLVLKWCAMTYIEDQDMWRLNGIFREVYLTALCDNHIKDIYIRHYLSDNFKSAEIVAEVKGGQKNLCYALFSPNGALVCSGKGDEDDLIKINVENPELWSDETPSLYQLIFHNGDEFIPINIGLRDIRIENAIVLINGEKVKAKGVNRHDSHPELGHTVPFNHLKNDLFILKRHNINTIRTAHYPNNPEMVDLCDKLGFYVIAEADLETHGLAEQSPENWHRLSSDPCWENAYLDRMERCFERDKNHSCIVFWSLANESGVGVNIRKEAEYLKSRDERVLITYDGSSWNKSDYGNDFIDIDSHMYAPVSKCREILEASSRPYYLTEYGHAMGNVGGTFKEYWDYIYSEDRFWGGCVWEFCDHSVVQYDEKGNYKYMFGGDYGDMPNNESFCIDGLVSPDRTIHTSFMELKNIIQPAMFSFSDGALSVENRRCFKDFSDLALNWNIEADGESVCFGRKDSLDILPKQSRKIKIDFDFNQNKIYYLNISLVQKHNTLWAGAGHEVASAQLLLCDNSSKYFNKSSGTIDVFEDEYTIYINSYENQVKFSKKYARIESIISNGKQMITEPIGFNAWRAPIYNNDNGYLQNWKDNALDRLIQKVYEVKIERAGNQLVIRTKIALGGYYTVPAITADVEYIFNGEGEIIIGVDAKVCEFIDHYLPRFGVPLVMPADCKRMTYYGFGPYESYIDKHSYAKMGRYENTVKEDFVNYIVPQESSSHYNTHWAMVGNLQGHGLFFTPMSQQGFSFQATNYSTKNLTDTKHDFELVPEDSVFVNLDYKMSGVGTEGPPMKEEYSLNEKQFKYSVMIKPIFFEEIDPFYLSRKSL